MLTNSIVHKLNFVDASFDFAGGFQQIEVGIRCFGGHTGELNGVICTNVFDKNATRFASNVAGGTIDEELSKGDVMC